MAQKLDEPTAKFWQELSTKLGEIDSLITDCRLILLLKLNITQGKPLKAIENIENAVSGMSYLFHPQTEWTGGDSKDPKNFKHTLPHIAR